MIENEIENIRFDYLGAIPPEWNIKRFKYCVAIRNGKEYAAIEVDDGGYPVIGSGGEFARASKYIYNQPSVLLGRKGTIDKPLYIDRPFWSVDTMFYTEIYPNMIPKYIYYVATIFRFDYYLTSTALPSMTQRDLGSEYIPVPKKEEQKQIADFLDKKIGIIDEIITKTENQIETLKMYKKSLIFEAITKGLEKNFPMKESGVVWMGNVPSNWIGYRAKYLFKIREGGAWGNDENNNEDDVICIRVADFDYDNLQLKQDSDFTYRNYPKKVMKNLQLVPGDILVEKSGGGENTPVGRTVVFKENYTALFANFMDRLRVKEFVDPYFIQYLFVAMYQNNITKMYIKQTTGIQNLDLSTLLSEEYFYVPTKKVQSSIVEYLDEMCQKIDRIRNEKQVGIETMKSYKKSLIYQYVTGKKRVKEANE